MDSVAEPGIKFTKSDFDLLPEDLRVELIGGELLKMTFPVVRHQDLVGRLYLGLVNAVGRKRVLVGSVGFVIDEFNVLGPDLVVFHEDAIPDRDAKDIDRAALVVEVLSPSTASRDRKIKAGLYLGAGVGEVWLVDAAQRTVEVMSPAGVRVAQGDQDIASEIVPEFAVRLSELFEP